MTTARWTLLVSVLVLIGLASWVSAGLPPADEADQPVPKFQQELLEAAANYQAWGRVDDEMRWAPTLCRMPDPGRLAVSRSEDEETHGQKLYSLFARHRDSYFSTTADTTAEVGQVIVKQSWIPEEITDDAEKPATPRGRRDYDINQVIVTAVAPHADETDEFSETADHFYPFVWQGDKLFQAKEQADLFIMLKLDPNTPDTDQGWVYGTVTPDGKTVTSAGRVASCMKCHQAVQGDRLFGMGYGLEPQP